MNVETDPVRLLSLAARLGWRGVGLVEPNPPVGAVIVRDGRIIGMGHHRRFGGPHAEREAIDNCRFRGEDPRGATLAVTLEPCAHQGKQPPCVGAIVEAGIARVIIACRDPHEEAGGGAAWLRKQGVAVDFVSACQAANDLNSPYVKRLTRGMPWVIAKWAQTLDGRVATRTGESKWISGPRARRRVHVLRARVDAIITGLGTVMADDPMLTARDVRHVRRIARRVVTDPDLEIPLDRAVVRSARNIPLTIACDATLADADITHDKRQALVRAGAEILPVPASGHALDLAALLRLLADRHRAANVLIEAGPGLLGAMFAADLIDECVVYVAPMLLGDDLARTVQTGRIVESLSAARRFRLVRARRIDNDMELVYRKPT